MERIIENNINVDDGKNNKNNEGMDDNEECADDNEECADDNEECANDNEDIDNCIICGKPTGSDGCKSKKYCNRTCLKRAYKWKKLSDEERQKRIDNVRKKNRQCEVCNKPLAVNAPITKIYCSDACRSYASDINNGKKRRKPGDVNLVKKNCFTCNKSFETDNNNKLYCDTVCKGRARSLENLDDEERQDKIDRIGKTFNCKNCDEEFQPNRIDAINFCSRKCHNDHAMKELKNKKNICYNFLEECKKEQGECAICDESNIRLFEFAHYDRKSKNIDMSHCKDINKIKNELKLGRWLCVWCHRDETYWETGENKNKKVIENKKYVKKIKLEIGKCDICKIKVKDSTNHLFDFDHIDQATKSTEVAQLMKCDLDIIKEEIDKCRLLCCKCHRLYSIQQQYDNLERKKLQKEQDLDD
jgi:hypothetical protein